MYSLSFGESHILGYMVNKFNSLKSIDNILISLDKYDSLILSEKSGMNHIANRLKYLDNVTKIVFEELLSIVKDKLKHEYKKHKKNLNKFDNKDLIKIRQQFLYPNALNNLIEFIGKGRLLLFLIIIDICLDFITDELITEKWK